MDNLYNCNEIASRYGVSIFTVWDWIKSKKLPAMKIGRQYKVKESALLAFENERRTVQQEKDTTLDV